MPDPPRRWIDESDDEPLADPDQLDPAAAARRLNFAATAAGAGLLIAAAGALLSVLTYADRGPADTVAEHPAGSGPRPAAPTSSYTVHFLLRADLPVAFSALLCIGPFLWWHLTVDRVARRCGDNLDAPDWVPIGGWFVPVFNLKLPILSIRELAEAHGAPLAARAAIGWWGLAATGVGIEAIVLRAQHQSKDLTAIDRSGMAAGCSLAAAALLGLLVVGSLTAAARARLQDLESGA